MSTCVLAFLIGVVARLRSMTSPAAVSWAARLGLLHLENTPLAFPGLRDSLTVNDTLASISGPALEPLHLLEINGHFKRGWRLGVYSP